jgi:hypothetical protein
VTADIDLLRRYEPILKFTEGELFFPTSIEGYIARCSLWVRGEGETHRLLIPAGSVAVEDLVKEGHRDPGVYLRFVQHPITGTEYQHWARHERPPFKAPGRLARVGLVSRFADGLFTLSLLMRGKVPGGTTAAASRQYRQAVGAAPPFVYYGRVVRSGGYIALHYMFFYYMNDWRSTFYGVNDHEADWEQAYVYLSDDEDGEIPLWVAGSAHDYFGDDLRRRWDDPAMTVEGTHPVLYPGGGSHAHYFEAGEYLTPVGLRFLKPLDRASSAVSRVWRNVLRQGGRSNGDQTAKQGERFFSLPFVDYARGDGQAVGPGYADWSPRMLHEDLPWVGAYRGLWGLDTDDIFDGELAPAGPAYTRGGAIRQSWHDPLAWAGLAKVPPPDHQIASLEEQIHVLQCQQELVTADLARETAVLRGLNVEVEALRSQRRLKSLFAVRERDLVAAERRCESLSADATSLNERLEACRSYISRLQAGLVAPPEAHIHRKRRPDPPQRQRLGKVAEFWAAASVGIVLVLAAVMLWIDVDRTWLIGALLGSAVLVDAILRGYIERLLLNVAVVLAAASTLILLHDFYWQAAIAGIAGVGAIVLWDNVRELHGR